MKTRCFGRIISRFETISSTNQFAEELLLHEKPCEGSVVLAGFQENGRGAGNNSWHSEAGKNLLASIILYPENLSPSRQFELNKVISLAVLYCVKSLIPSQKVVIKWPNDIYVDYKKIAGILTKNTIAGNVIGHTIVGVGLNVNEDTFPAELPNPVSLKQLSGQLYEIDEVLRALMNFLEILYEKIKYNEFDFIHHEYLENLLNLNRKAWYRKENQLFEGIIRGVSPFGKLMMETDNVLSEYDFKEISFLFKNFESQ